MEESPLHNCSFHPGPALCESFACQHNDSEATPEEKEEASNALMQYDLLTDNEERKKFSIGKDNGP